MTQPFVSVLIPVFNGLDRLKFCLHALEKQTYSEDRYEVIVIDNGFARTIDGHVGSFAHVRVGHELTPTSYAARNTGLAMAKGELVAFTDSDCIPAIDWVENGVRRFLGTPNCGLVAGKIQIFFKDPDQPTGVELYDLLRALDQQTYVEKGRFGATANLFTSRAIFDRVGWFDASLKSGGDLEWGQRVSDCGYRLVYSDDVQVLHPAKRTLSGLFDRAARIIGGMHDLNRKKRCSYVGIGRGLFVDALPPVGASVRVFFDARIVGLSNKTKVIAVLFFVQYAQVLETLRLKLGGDSRR